MATISDQGRTNEGAIKLLKTETKDAYIKRNGFYEIQLDENKTMKIVHIFDVPHLMKGIRNNLLTKDLVFCMDGNEGRAKWSHI